MKEKVDKGRIPNGISSIRLKSLNYEHRNEQVELVKDLNFSRRIIRVFRSARSSSSKHVED